MSNERAQTIKEELLMDKNQVLEENLSEAKELIYLREDGGVDFKVNRGDLTNKEEIQLYLVGVWFSSEAELRDSEIVDADEVFTNTSISNKQSAVTRLNELKKSGKVEGVSKGEYRINAAMIQGILAEIKGNKEER